MASSPRQPTWKAPPWRRPSAATSQDQPLEPRKEYSMGLIDFIKDVGHKLNVGGHDEPKAAQQAQGQHPQVPAQAAPQAAQGPSQQDLKALENRKKATALTN